MRALIAAERYAEALANERLMARPIKQMPYQTLGALRPKMAGEGEPVTDYPQWLDLETGEAVTERTAGGPPLPPQRNRQGCRSGNPRAPSGG